MHIKAAGRIEAVLSPCILRDKSPDTKKACFQASLFGASVLHVFGALVSLCTWEERTTCWRAHKF
jgi:hypothetical protein